MPTFTTPGFKLESVTAIAPATVRVRFTFDPKTLDRTASNDGLNPSNYMLAGPNVVAVTAIATVPSDPQSLDVYLNAPMDVGNWTLLVSNVVSSGGSALTTPNSLNFNVSSIVNLEPVTGGTITDKIEDIIRKHLPRSFVGKAWDAIIAALASSDQVNLDNAMLAFDQLFLASASGVYLDRLASESGVERPKSIGMPDETYRNLSIKLTTKKVTAHTLLEILEVFYGMDAVRAHLETVAEEPFTLNDGDSLTIFDGNNTVDIVFVESDFAQIGQATANEVAAVITRQAESSNLNVFATTLTDPTTGKNKVRLYSGALGLTSTLIVQKGLANNALLFPASVALSTFPSSSSFTITTPSPGVARYTSTSANTPLLHVLVGDYVNITSQAMNVANRGSFTVNRVSTTWNGAAWVSFFEVSNDAVMAEGPVTTLLDADLQFYRPQRAQLLDISGRTVVLAQGENGSIDVTLPATTEAVGRDEFTAAYLPARDTIAISSCVITGDGVAHVTTATDHGLSVGNQVIVEGLWADATQPATLAGTPGTTGNIGTSDVNQLTFWSSLRSDLSVRAFSAAAQLTTADILVAGGIDTTGTPGTPLHTCSRFRVTSQATVGSGSAQGRTQYSYNWIATADILDDSSDHSLTALQGLLAGHAVLAGGRKVSGLSVVVRNTHKVMLYDSTGNTWTDVPGTFTARYAHVAINVKTATGDDAVYFIGGNTAPTTGTGQVERFVSTSGGTTESVFTEAFGERIRHAGCAVTDNAWLVSGGSFAAFPFARNDCVGYDHVTATQLTLGLMSFARMDHVMVQIGDGMAMAIGGIGHNVSNETSDRTLSECEIWDKRTGSWYAAPSMQVARSAHQAVVLGNKVYVFGGLDNGGNPVTLVEVFDIDKQVWIRAPHATNTVDANGAFAVWSNSFIFHLGGRVPAGTPTNTALALIPGLQLGADVNGVVSVVSTPNTNQFTFNTLSGHYANVSGGEMLPMGAIESDVAGPYLWNEDGDPAVTAVEAVIQEDLIIGQQYRTLTIDDATDFPDAPGWLVFGYGTDEMVYPVQYLGKISNTQLILDYSFKFPLTVKTNAKVTLLAQKGPFIPDAPETLGSCYITGSSAGRVIAEQTLVDASAAGRQINVTVGYPGDKGLGNAGLPVSGSARIADKVAVWGGDDLDAELAAARGE